MQKYVQATLIFVGRVLLTAVIQVATIYFILSFEDTDAIGYLLLFIPVIVLATVVLNTLLIEWFKKVESPFKSPMLVKLTPYIIVGVLALASLLLYLIPVAPIRLLPLYFIVFCIPTLVIELIISSVWKSFQKNS